MPIIDQLSGPTPKRLSLEGLPGPDFENESQRFTSNIHALTLNQGLEESEDLLTGRRYIQGGISAFVGDSKPPVSFPNRYAGRPYYPSLGGPYSLTGPRDGIYW